MHELTNIINEKSKLIDARLLYQHLKVGRDFSDWIKGRIEKYDFQENRDYFTKNHRTPDLGSNRGGHNRIDYYITISMAKELCLLQNNEIGRAYRKYLINFEEQAQKQALAIPAPKVINGIKCISYVGWILTNSYSPTSGQVRERIKKYPQQFIKTKDGWYMSEAIAEYFLDFRNPKEKIEALPYVSPKQLDLFKDSGVDFEQVKQIKVTIEKV